MTSTAQHRRMAGLLAVLLACAAAPAGAGGDDYPAFSQFAAAAFGAERDPLVYAFHGQALGPPEAYWEHVSERSVAIGFRSNLPARAHVEYGTTPAYGQRTDDSDRHYAVHLHRLTGLQPGTTYHYRVVMVDERGNQVAGPDRTVVPATPPGVVRIPDQMPGGPPWLLDSAGTTYLVTADLVAPGKAFEIAAAGVTLDLGGHVVTYNQVAQAIAGDWPDYVDNAAFGVRAMGYRDDLRIVNGTLRQGAGGNAAHAGASIGFNLVYVRPGDRLEVAGVEFDYRGPQMVGLFMHWGGADAHVHHNVFTDRGSVILNRHGSGARALIFYGGDYGASRVHDNLVRRTRQGGVQGNQVHHNEIYVDSWSINSFAIGRGDQAAIHDNRIFGTGYHVVGIAWGRANHYHGNLVHLVGQGPDHRDDEYGNQESLNGFRLTQYAGATADYSDNLYEGNLILIQGGDCIDGACTEARGIQHSSDAAIVNNVIRGNTIKVAMADNIGQAAAIVTQGLRKRCGTEDPVLWQDNLLISNIANVRMGDYYAAGCNHRLHGNHLVRLGDRPDYRSYQFDVGWDLRDHHVVDASHADGASIDSLRFRNAGQQLHVGWTVQVRVESAGQPVPGAQVEVFDLAGDLVASGNAGADGVLAVVVPERIRMQSGDTWRTPTRFVARHGDDSVEQELAVHAPATLVLDLVGRPDVVFGDGFEGL